MKRIGILAIVMFAMAFSAFAEKPKLNAEFNGVGLGQAGSNPTGILFNWQYTSTIPPACPTTGTPANCFSGFMLTDMTTGQVLATSTSLGPTAVSFSWIPSGGLYFGTHTFSIVATGFGALSSTGASTPIQSAAVTTTVTNNLTTLNPPTGFTGAVN